MGLCSSGSLEKGPGKLVGSRREVGRDVNLSETLGGGCVLECPCGKRKTLFQDDRSPW